MTIVLLPMQKHNHHTINPDSVSESYQLADYFGHQLEIRLPGLLRGLYIYGSSVLQDFRPGRSDVDFVAIICHAPSATELKTLASLHREMRHTFPSRLDGIYTDETTLGKQSNSFPSCSNGAFGMWAGFERNAVTWYQLRHRSLCVRGVPREELPFSVSIEDVLNYQHTNIHSYWQQWVNTHATFGKPQGWMLLHPRKVSWGVLGVTRQLYTLHTKEIASKSQAGEWALAYAAPEYYPILREAVGIRQGREKSEYSSPFRRRRECLDYMRSVIAKYEETAAAWLNH